MTIPMTGEKALLETLKAMCAQRSIKLVVIGLPLSADGTEGAGCARARRIAAALHASGVSAKLQDERWSSRDAEEILRQTGKRRQRSKEKVDAIAASLILSEYLREVSRT
jgi:putative Holliday junction resolvase